MDYVKSRAIGGSLVGLPNRPGSASPGTPPGVRPGPLGPRSHIARASPLPGLAFDTAVLQGPLSAAEGCEVASEGPATPDIEKLRARYEAQDQGHVFRFWDSLEPTARDRLCRQAAAIDLSAVLRGYRATQERGARPAPKIEPPEVEELPERGGDAARREAARERGEALLAAGRVAALVVAGGQGSRLGYPGPKGLFPLGPVTGRSLFALQAQKLRRLRARTGHPLPWYVMTSPATDADTRRAFAEADGFGLPAEDVFFLQQGTLPSFDFEGHLILERPDRIFENPNGHGGALLALRDSGALDDMERRGISTLFYYQVDNPLVPMGDPVLLGFHDLAGAEMSCKVLRKRDPAEKVGVVARVDGHVGVVEYTEIDDEHRHARDGRGELLFGAGNMAVHGFDPAFVRRVADGADRWLPYHASAKKIPCVDDAGRPVEPETPNGTKLERFVFDALPAARRVTVVEASRDEYSPVKNATGDDSPQTARRDLSAHYRRWLEAAGLDAPAEGTALEIDEARIGGPEDLQRLGIRRIADAPDSIHVRTGDQP